MCKRCLLSETDGTLYRTVLAYIDAISPEEKAPMAEYERRLDICRACDQLTNGMCALCGCFVEVRAAKIKHRCVRYEW